MLSLFPPVKCLLKREPVCIDNLVFRLHSRATVILLLVCTILVSAKQYVGEPISCITGSTIDKAAVDAYCWIHSTFTVSRHLKGMRGQSVASPGVGQVLHGDEIFHHRYYQWVCFVLGLQAILFYAPRALWGAWERGTVSHLSSDLSSPFVRDIWTEERKRQLVDYFTRTHLHTHNFYGFRFFICEILNFLNAVGQLYVLNVFFEGQFLQYGLEIIAFATEKNPSERMDPMARLFPKVTKCILHTFGASGSLQIHDALCVLPLNAINEKIVVFFWFWLIFLASASVLALIYRIIIFSQRRVRVYLLRAEERTLTRSKAESIVQVLDFGDWFLLYQLSQNLNPIVYKELVNEIAVSFSLKHLERLP